MMVYFNCVYVMFECQGPLVKGQGHVQKIIIYLFQLVMWLQFSNKVKAIHQGQGQINVISKKRHSYAGSLHLSQMRSSTSCTSFRNQVNRAGILGITYCADKSTMAGDWSQY